MPINEVQACSAVGHNAVNAVTTFSIAAAFSSGNTAGNTLVVFAFANCGTAGAGVSLPVLTDSQGNTYTQDFWIGTGNANGSAIGIWHVNGINAGANTVTFSYRADGGSNGFANGFQHTVIAAEYSGMPSAMFQDKAYAQIDGATGGTSAITIALTDSHGATVNTTFGNFTTGLGAVSSGAVVADYLYSGVNYLIAAAFGTTAGFPVPTSSYETFVQEITADDTGSGGNHYSYLWDYGVPGPSPIAPRQPQIFLVY